MVFQGSKGKIAKYIVPILQKTIDENKLDYFYDICVGGAHIVEKVQCKNRIAGDINANLIALYQKAINDDIEWPAELTREDWDKAKDHPDECEPWFVALVQYFASYSARGFGGGFALKDTSKRNAYKERLKNFQNQIPFIKDVNFQVIDILNWIGPEQVSCIYIDPPYFNTKKYDKIQFDYLQFWDKVRELSKNNYVYVSEMEAPDDFKIIWQKEVLRTLLGSPSIVASEKLFKWENGL